MSTANASSISGVRVGRIALITPNSPPYRRDNVPLFDTALERRLRDHPCRVRHIRGSKARRRGHQRRNSSHNACRACSSGAPIGNT